MTTKELTDLQDKIFQAKADLDFFERESIRRKEEHAYLLSSLEEKKIEIV
jgi:hypothetical protein